MGVSVSVLASGSRGNSTVIESSQARILGGCGNLLPRNFQAIEVNRSLDPRSLSAILITHEHSDHVSGLADSREEAQPARFHDGCNPPGMGTIAAG
jgi:phosphoribosyl 1,2-cyclic phosphodiesterase